MYRHWRIFIVLICFHFNSYFCDDGSPFIKFKKISSISERNQTFVYLGATKPIETDGTFPQVLIKVADSLNSVPPTVIIHCIVDKLAQNSYLKRAELCVKYHHSRKTQCENAENGQLFSDRFRFIARGNSTIGYIFQSNWERNSVSLDAFYYCKLSNRNGIVTSQSVEIQDIEFYTKKFVVARPIGEIRKGPLIGSDFPAYFDCGDRYKASFQLPVWAQNSFQSPFKWLHCDAEADESLDMLSCYTKALASRESIDTFFETSTLPNGTLILHQRTTTPWRRLGLLCTSPLVPKKVFAAYFQRNGNNSVSFEFRKGFYTKAIIPRSPLLNMVEYRAVEYEMDSVFLVALYTADPTLTKTKWLKNGRPLPPAFQSFDHSLVFPKELKPEDSGNYTLLVESAGETVEFVFQVTVNAPPRVVRSAPPNVYVLEGKLVQIENTFEGILNSRTIDINGIPINTLSQSKIAESLRFVKEHFPYIGDLDVDVEFPTGASIRYSVRDISFMPNSPYGASHTVTMKATNTLGSAQVQTIIRVLPVPKVIGQLSDYYCEDECFNQTVHKFHCDIDLAPYAGLRVSKTWELDGKDLAALDPRDHLLAFLKFTNNEAELHIPSDNSTFDSLFATAELSCRFRVYSPEVDFFGTAPFDSLYDTKENSDLHSLLTARIRKTPTEGAQTTSVASLSWITAVVIAILILLTVAILAVCVVMRNKGQTYLLDREERALGNDPEKEFRDRENFKVYERAEDQPIPGCNISINDTFQDVGSDDEGELDSYGMDPGNFNETGSFIGEYSRGTARRPNTVPTTSIGPI